MGDIDLHITLEEYKRGWKRQKEKTTLHGILHFGHFKASCYNNVLADFDRMMLEICLRSGHIFPRWTHSTDVLIPKKQNSNKVTELRTICLLAADWNFGNKLLGKRIMAHAEAAGSIAKEQYGSRKNKSSIKHATNKALLFDIQRQKKEDTALMILDAEACYDRVPLHIAALSLRRQGLPTSAAKFMFDPIYKMTHTLRTAHGESEQTYHSKTNKLHGILQGTGAGPCIWVMVSSPLLEHLREAGHGIEVRTDDTGAITRVPAFAFVDDNDAVETTTKSPTPLLRPQRSLTTWGRDLRALGGNLKWSKCFWQWLIYRWTPSNRWKLQSINESDHDLIIVTATNETITLTRKEITAATLALGIMFSADGSMHDEVALLRNKAKTWSDKVRTSSLNRDKVWYGFNHCILRGIHYPLPATTINREDMTTVMAPLLTCALPQSGICRNISRHVVYSLPKHRGFGVANPWVYQGIHKLFEFLNFESTDNTSTLIRESYRLAILESGLGPNFFSHKYSSIHAGIMTNGFIRFLWEFISQTNIQLVTTTPPQSHFPADFYLMEHFLVLDPSNPQVADFNACRKYLQAETFSNIITLDGKQLRYDAWNGNSIQPSKLWPNQPRPTNSAWTVWRQYISEITSCSTTGTLLRPQYVTVNLEQWDWFLHASSDTIYAKMDTNLYRTFTFIAPTRRSSRHVIRFQPTQSTTTSMPEFVKPITICIDNAEIIGIESRSYLFDQPSHTVSEP